MRLINSIVVLIIITFFASTYSCYLEDECNYTTDLESTGENIIKISNINPETNSLIKYGDLINVVFDYSLENADLDEYVMFTLYLIDGDERHEVAKLADNVQGGYESCYIYKKNLGHGKYSIEFKPDISLFSPYTFRLDIEKYDENTGEVIETLLSSNTWTLY